MQTSMSFSKKDDIKLKTEIASEKKEENKQKKRHRFFFRLKCPYCPVEQNPEDARLIYF